MKSKYLSAIIVSFVLFSTQAQAQVPDEKAEKLQECLNRNKVWREPAVINSHENIRFSPRSGKAVSVDQVKNAIERGAKNTILSRKGAKGKDWTTEHVSKGKTLATLDVRKHRIVVEIDYTANEYSLRYKDSAEMNYVFCEGKGYIHPSYNKWVLELKNGIQAQLEAL